MFCGCMLECRLGSRQLIFMLEMNIPAWVYCKAAACFVHVYVIYYVAAFGRLLWTKPSQELVVQTDGWFSEKSASIYEASTETLFLGRQDAMQRGSLVPLHKFMQARSRGRDTKGDNTKMLEVACGTGRFATFVKVLYLD